MVLYVADWLAGQNVLISYSFDELSGKSRYPKTRLCGKTFSIDAREQCCFSFTCFLIDSMRLVQRFGNFDRAIVFKRGSSLRISVRIFNQIVPHYNRV